MVFFNNQIDLSEIYNDLGLEGKLVQNISGRDVAEFQEDVAQIAIDDLGLLWDDLRYHLRILAAWSSVRLGHFEVGGSSVSYGGFWGDLRFLASSLCLLPGNSTVQENYRTIYGFSGTSKSSILTHLGGRSKILSPFSPCSAILT